MYSNLKLFFHDDSRRLGERLLNIHMSQVNVVRLYLHCINILCLFSTCYTCVDLLRRLSISGTSLAQNSKWGRG